MTDQVREDESELTHEEVQSRLRGDPVKQPKLFICFDPKSLNEDDIHIIYNVPEQYGEIKLKAVSSWSVAVSLAKSIVVSEPDRKALACRRADGPNHADDLKADLDLLVEPAGYIILVDGIVKHYKSSGVRT